MRSAIQADCRLCPNCLGSMRSDAGSLEHKVAEQARQIEQLRADLQAEQLSHSNTARRVGVWLLDRKLETEHLTAKLIKCQTWLLEAATELDFNPEWSYTAACCDWVTKARELGKE